MKTEVEITGYVDEPTKTYILKTQYREFPSGQGRLEYESYGSLYKLYKEMMKHIANAKENNYDYTVDLKGINLVEPDSFDYRTN